MHAACTTAARSSGKHEQRPPHPDHPQDAPLLVQRALELGTLDSASPGREEDRRRVGRVQAHQSAGQLDCIASTRAGREKVPSREPCAPLLDGDRPHAQAPAASSASFTSRSASSLCSRRTAV